MLGDNPLTIEFTEADDGAVIASLVDPDSGALIAQARYGTAAGSKIAQANSVGHDVLLVNRRKHAAALVIDAAFRQAEWDVCRG